VPNGVDLQYFRPETESEKVSSMEVVFVGMMDYFPNVDAVLYFCQNILPRIRASVPEVRFLIVGRNPTATVKKLAHDPHVIVTGSVPDVRPYLTRAVVAVAPFRIARGIQNKVLEAMAMGIPVVGTSLAFQGLGVTHEDGIRQVDDPDQFAQAVVVLIRDIKKQRECMLQARRYVERHHEWDKQGVLLTGLIKETSIETPDLLSSLSL
jgi:glycosyltransferase involved in cell wall biosynthesis